MDPYINRLDSLWDKVDKGGGNPSSSNFIRSSLLAILHQALADPKTFVGFIQLCTHPIIVHILSEKEKEVENEMLIRMLRTCYLFAVGTWSEYRTAAAATASLEDSSSYYLHLTSSQIQKLKSLSLVSFLRCTTMMMTQQPMTATVSSNHFISSNNSTTTMDTDESSTSIIHRHQHDDSELMTISKSKSKMIIPYMKLQAEFDFPDIPSLEDFLIHCMYSKLIPSGSRLNPQQQCLMLGCCLSSSAATSSSTNTSTNHEYGNRNDGSIHDSSSSSLFFARDVAFWPSSLSSLVLWKEIIQKNHNENDSTIISNTTSTMTPLDEMISTLEKIQIQGMDLLQTLDKVQKDNEQLYHTQTQKWIDIDKRVEEVRVYSKATFSNKNNNTVMMMLGSGGMMGGGGATTSSSSSSRVRNENRQFKRSRGAGFVNYHGKT